MFLQYFLINPGTAASLIRARATAAGPMEALHSVMGADSNLGWEWDIFCKYYTRGWLYHSSPTFPDFRTIVGLCHGSVYSGSIDDSTGKTFSWTSYDLSAHFVRATVSGKCPSYSALLVMYPQGAPVLPQFYGYTASGSISGDGLGAVEGANDASGNMVYWLKHMENALSRYEGLFIVVVNDNDTPPWASQREIQLTVKPFNPQKSLLVPISDSATVVVGSGKLDAYVPVTVDFRGSLAFKGYAFHLGTSGHNTMLSSTVNIPANLDTTLDVSAREMGGSQTLPNLKTLFWQVTHLSVEPLDQNYSTTGDHFRVTATPTSFDFTFSQPTAEQALIGDVVAAIKVHFTLIEADGNIKTDDVERRVGMHMLKVTSRYPEYHFGEIPPPP
ncbi:MAG: hypothetical protein H5T86_14620 [Armatimonadetes bacterium]|nr:hypothetical protein [Armatimonadota bacterium]